MGHLDTTFKEMTRRCLLDLVRWLLPTAGAAEIIELPQELPATLRRVDALVRLAPPGAAPQLRILECQAQRDATLHPTMLLRAALAHLHYDLPVSTMLLCLTPEAVVTPRYLYGSCGAAPLHHEVEVVRLYDLSGDRLLAEAPSGLLPLVPVLRPDDGDRARLLREVLDHIADLDLPPERRRLLMSWCATFATLNLNEAQVQAILDGVARRRQTMLNVLEQTPFGKRLINEGIGQGMAQSILRVLSARSIPVSEDLRERVLSCTDPVQLDRWIARAALASSAEEALAEG